MAQTSSLIEQRTKALAARLQQMREMDEWHLFQNFILGLLPHDGYTDVRVSAVRNDFGRDGVAMTPDGKKCVVAVSFDCCWPISARMPSAGRKIPTAKRRP